MGDIAIRVEQLGKQYRIGKRERYQTLRDTLTSAITLPFSKVGNLLKAKEAYGMTEASHQMAVNPLPPGTRTRAHSLHTLSS